MECTTVRVDANNEVITQPKRQFLTQEEAIKHCKYMNSLPDRQSKIAPYKCTTCHKFHVGRNGKQIKEKDKLNKKELDRFLRPEKYKTKRIFTGFKVVGKIDL